MTTDEMIARMSAALHERDRLKAYVAKLEGFGSQLANCAYNLKQQDRLTEHERACLDAAQRGFDEAKRLKP